ncbi:LCP family protein [Serinibacter salmoneus]|uniref:LytR family transcriptional attenuator n=1 Tax=Serinibacter salmoneus TaxID=556530 RepID=A0A2A9D116_9MICO|nr:LCP family protein [Serinibacter salmoneus]PFG20367.1 LytR family transcriptional attenuator [Serinibacter salmoneus]
MPSSPRPTRHARRLIDRRWLRALATALVAVLAFSGTAVAAMYYTLTHNISSNYALEDFRPTPEVEEAVATEGENPTDPMAGQDWNILLIGSDSRDGENGDVSGDGDLFEGARADTTILLHLPADRSRAEAVSIPRDLLTAVPSCVTDSDGSTSWAQDSAMFNSAFATGGINGDVGLGAICTALTVEEMSGLTIDDYAVVDFAGFERMVDTIGGVPMCFPEALHDDLAGLDIAAGEQTLDGVQALALARARKSLGDGSDIQRIDRQQELLAAMVRQVLSLNLVTDSYALIQFLDAVTSSLTTSQGLGNPISLAGLALELAPIGAEGVAFVTLPFDPAGARVVANAQSEELWERLRNDEPLNSASAQPEETTSSDSTPSSSPSAAPQEDTSEDSEPSEDGESTPDEVSDPWEVLSGDEGATC